MLGAVAESQRPVVILQRLGKAHLPAGKLAQIIVTGRQIEVVIFAV